MRWSSWCLCELHGILGKLLVVAGGTESVLVAGGTESVPMKLSTMAGLWWLLHIKIDTDGAGRPTSDILKSGY
jgi:hypothetical protein